MYRTNHFNPGDFIFMHFRNTESGASEKATESFTSSPFLGKRGETKSELTMENALILFI